MTSQLRDYVRAAYGSAIGRARRDVVTPALILDLDAARGNIRHMAERMAGMKAKLRPHTKVQKCLELARLQIEAGAIGVCTATVWEGIVMSRAHRGRADCESGGRQGKDQSAGGGRAYGPYDSGGGR